MAKRIEWNNGAERDFEKTFDEDAQDVFITALGDIAEGHTLMPESGVHDDRHGHPLGNHVRKLKWSDDNGSTWRVVYIREYEEAIYVINAYQKKSKRGSQEPQENLNTTKIRLKWAEAEHDAHMKAERARKGQPSDRKKGGRS
ncbi:hypothetical protein D3C72_491670 [compost metagenome]